MLTKTHFKILAGALASVIFAAAAIAYGKTTVAFPVAELGNCSSQAACQQYCNKPQNIVACTDFGEQHGLIASQDAQKNRVLADSLKNGGPGGCTSEAQCSTYCAVAAHGQECLSFAQGHGLIASQDADRGKKIADLMASGKAPGSCTSQTACQQYCSQS